MKIEAVFSHDEIIKILASYVKNRNSFSDDVEVDSYIYCSQNWNSCRINKRQDGDVDALYNLEIQLIMHDEVTT